MITAFIVLGIGVVALAIVMIRRFPKIAMLDVDTIAEERERKAKERLARQRLSRIAASVGKKVSQATAPVTTAIARAWKRMHDRVMSLERKYQEERRNAHRPIAPDDAAKIRMRLEGGQKLMNEGRYAEAEEHFISVISLDTRSVPAYRALAKIYLELEQYDQARETLNFLLKLKPGDAESFAMRGEVAVRKGDLAGAIEELGKAMRADRESLEYQVRLAELLREARRYDEAVREMRDVVDHEPNNPKHLDFLTETSILAGRSDDAERALEKLRAANPENKKIGEFERRIAEM